MTHTLIVRGEYNNDYDTTPLYIFRMQYKPLKEAMDEACRYADLIKEQQPDDWDYDGWVALFYDKIRTFNEVGRVSYIQIDEVLRID